MMTLSEKLDKITAGFICCLLAVLLGCEKAPKPQSVPEVPLPVHATYFYVPPAPLVATIPQVDLDLPDTCDRLVWVMTPSGPQLSKRPPAWLRDVAKRREYQQWLRGVIAIVGDELGANPDAAEMIWRKSILESSGNPGAVHILTADFAANRAAAKRGRSASSERWAKAVISTYVLKNGALLEAGHYDAWRLGRGLYGQVTGLHVRRWGADVPPWSLCDERVATVTTIWSMRAGLAQCSGKSLRDAYRRFSSGRCEKRSVEREQNFDRLARGRVRGLKLEPFNPDVLADFGDHWPESGSDRSVLLARLRLRILTELGPSPLTG
jgi:hypothetical protein